MSLNVPTLFSVALLAVFFGIPLYATIRGNIERSRRERAFKKGRS